MICLVVFLAVASSAMAGYSDSTSGSNKVGNGYGYGYSGSFSSGTGGFAGAPLAPFPQFDFNNFLQQYFDSLRKYQEQIAAHVTSYSVAASHPHNRAEAQSSLTVENRRGAQHGAGFAGYGFPGGFPAFAGFGVPPQASGFGVPGQGHTSGFGVPGQGSASGFNIPTQGPASGFNVPAAGGAPGAGAAEGFPGFGGAFGGSFGGGLEGAAATAAIGSQGVHQTASLFPENPNIPNIDNRFGSTPQEGGSGFYSVSTSSQSGSSNLDGKPTSFHQATTTVNDNGKVTTYTVKKP